MSALGTDAPGSISSANSKARGLEHPTAIMYLGQFFREALDLPAHTIAYNVGLQLAERFPDRFVLEGSDADFELDEYAEANLCALEIDTSEHPQFSTSWYRDEGITTWTLNAWYEVAWRGHSLDVVLMSWGNCCRHHWILAENRAIAEEFFAAVCAFEKEIEDELLVFEGGWWARSEPLFDAIRSASLDDLVLAGSLATDLRDDVSRFFTARELYESHGIPWKRGILLTGPPGNGKTHTIKAVVNLSKKPCLYVRSFASEQKIDETNIRAIFTRARREAPCVLVLEDLDSLVTDDTRSFFLNELDGFASNAGILTLATTNHPERLDPAIVDRPSRFDRKYHFGLPDLDSRRSFVSKRNSGLSAGLRLTSPGIDLVAERTDGFSFAYLKELFLSSMMAWVANPQNGGMDAVMLEQAEALRSQMGSVQAAPAETSS